MSRKTRPVRCPVTGRYPGHARMSEAWTTRSARGDSCFLAKEQSWRTAWRARSLLSRTISGSATGELELPGRAIASRHKRQCGSPSNGRADGRSSPRRPSGVAPLTARRTNFPCRRPGTSSAWCGCWPDPSRWQTGERAFKPWGLANAPSLTVGCRPAAGLPCAGPCTALTPSARPPIPAIRIAARRRTRGLSSRRSGGLLQAQLSRVGQQIAQLSASGGRRHTLAVDALGEAERAQPWPRSTVCLGD